MYQKIIYIVLFQFCLFVTLSIAQENKGELKKENKANEKGFVTSKVNQKLLVKTEGNDDFYFDFGNINVIPFYDNQNELKAIRSLEKEGEEKEPELIIALERYVSNFGIDNFSRDTDLLWELAQLYEKKGDIEKAKSAYRLVLKHHRREVVKEIHQYLKIRQHYDETTELDRDYYVPLEYYYELVEYRRAIDTLRPPKSILTNMGDLVNEKNKPDYGPSINSGDNFMVFTRKLLDAKKSGIKPIYEEHLYYSQGYENNFWDEAVAFPEPIKSRCNEGSACMSRDGRTLYFSRCQTGDSDFDCSDCMGQCDLYVSQKRNDNTWAKPRNLGVNVNSISWESHPSLSKSEDTLYFVSDREGGFGLSDIYYTFKTPSGQWAKARNMGPIINTRNNEFSPFMNKDYDVFYFSSNGHILNFGDLDHVQKTSTLDIYKSYRVNNSWKEPKNVGPLVNGSGNEFYFTIDSKAKNLYYAKSEENSKDPLNTDLFSFPVPMGAQPMATVELKGELVDEKTGKPYKGIVSVIDLDNGIEVAPKEVRSDGTYAFDLIDHNNYLLVIQGDEFFRIEKLFYLDGDTTIASEATSVNKKLQFSSIVFENGKARILKEMEKDLWEVINFLVDNREFKVTIAGHTDSDGDPKANKKLSQERADAIKKFMMDNGFVESERIDAIGYGSTNPIRNPEVTEEDKRINRRVEFEISKLGEVEK